MGLDQTGLDKMGLDQMGIRPNGFRPNGIYLKNIGIHLAEFARIFDRLRIYVYTLDSRLRLYLPKNLNVYT